MLAPRPRRRARARAALAGAPARVVRGVPSAVPRGSMLARVTRHEQTTKTKTIQKCVS